jgi:LacI family transcriptional regulator
MSARTSRKTPPTARRVTLADIARKSDVSLTTVSLALRNKPGAGIPAETRQRILDAARTLGYRIKTTNGEPTQRLAHIGVVLKARADDIPQENPFYSLVLAGIDAACRQNRINLLYASLPVNEDNYPLEMPRLLDEEHVDGLLLVGAFVDETLAHVLCKKSMPVVLVDAYSDSTPYDAVVSDNYQGAYQAVSYLIENGHRHIGVVGGHRHAYPSIRERRRGYADALQDHDIANIYSIDCPYQLDEAYLATQACLEKNPQITALFGVNDKVALSVSRAVQSMGKRVPEDVSVIGFDDIELAHLASPALTTMQVDKIGMGRLAIQTLINRLQMPDNPRATLALRVRLIERQSVMRI